MGTKKPERMSSPVFLFNLLIKISLFYWWDSSGT